MKNLLFAGLIICGLTAHAGMHGRDHYIHFQAGMQISNDLLRVENGQATFSYGMPLESDMGSYFGFTEIGVKSPTALLSLKYGYQCMRDRTFSFGTDIALLFGISSLSLAGNYAMNDLVLGGNPGIFVKMKTGDNLSLSLRGGLLLEAPLKNLLNDLFLMPVVELGFQYHL